MYVYTDILYFSCVNNACLLTDRSTILELKRLRVNIGDFEVKNVIGRGHFGEVHVSVMLKLC